MNYVRNSEWKITIGYCTSCITSRNLSVFVTIINTDLSIHPFNLMKQLCSNMNVAYIKVNYCIYTAKGKSVYTHWRPWSPVVLMSKLPLIFSRALSYVAGSIINKDDTFS